LNTANRTPTSDASLRPAIPVMAVVFLSFIIIGMALPSTAAACARRAGIWSTCCRCGGGRPVRAALISRLWAGLLSDSRGAKYAVVLGLSVSVIGGMFYIASLLVLNTAVLSVTLILIGRTLLGGAESDYYRWYYLGTRTRL
jgi:hypothetical protein